MRVPSTKENINWGDDVIGLDGRHFTNLATFRIRGNDFWNGVSDREIYGPFCFSSDYTIEIPVEELTKDNIFEGAKIIALEAIGGRWQAKKGEVLTVRRPVDGGGRPFGGWPTQFSVNERKCYCTRSYCNYALITNGHDKTAEVTPENIKAGDIAYLKEDCFYGMWCWSAGTELTAVDDQDNDTMFWRWRDSCNRERFIAFGDLTRTPPEQWNKEDKPVRSMDHADVTECMDNGMNGQCDSNCEVYQRDGCPEPEGIESAAEPEIEQDKIYTHSAVIEFKDGQKITIPDPGTDWVFEKEIILDHFQLLFAKPSDDPIVPGIPNKYNVGQVVWVIEWNEDIEEYEFISLDEIGICE